MSPKIDTLNGLMLISFSGILQGVYWGLGGGIGAILGGIMIDEYGAVSSFHMGAAMSGTVLIASAIIQFWIWKKEQSSFTQATLDNEL